MFLIYHLSCLYRNVSLQFIPSIVPLFRHQLIRPEGDFHCGHPWHPQVYCTVSREKSEESDTEQLPNASFRIQICIDPH